MNNYFKFSFCLITLLLLALVGCSKETITANKLEGTWNVTSFIVDGDEMIGIEWTSYKWTFNDYKKDKGTTKWVKDATINGGSVTTKEGDYYILEKGDKANFIFPAQSQNYLWDIRFDDNKTISITGVTDGTTYSIKAKKE